MESHTLSVSRLNSKMYKMGLILLTIFMPNFVVMEKTIDLEACRNCSGRKDVPCVIQEMPYPCAHREFGTKWPGTPRDLTNHIVSLSNDTAAFNFTWKPPFDASVSFLDGFLLTVNIHLIGMAPLLPYCFMANVSGTDWSTVKDPHSVLFHFDCVRASSQMEIHVNLVSSPMPVTAPNDQRLQPVHQSARYKRNDNDYAYPNDPCGWQKTLNKRSIFPSVDLPKFTPPSGFSMEKPPTDFTIKFFVKSTTVDVKFGPIEDNMEYCVCLVDPLKKYTCLEKELPKIGDNFTTFHNVAVGSYKVLVSPQPDSRLFEPMLYISREFVNITAPDVPEDEGNQEDAKLMVLVIILSVLGAIIAATVFMFKTKRIDRHRGCNKWVLCHCSDYTLTPVNSQRNNCLDEELGQSQTESDLIPLMMNESSEFLAAVSQVCTYIGHVTKMRINFQCDDNNQYQLIKSKGKDGIIVIFLSKTIFSLLKEPEEIVPSMELDVPREVTEMREILRLVKGKEFKKIMIAFGQVSGDLSILTDTQRFDLSLGPQNGVNKGNFKMHFGEILKTVTGNEVLPMDWLDNEMMHQIQTSILQIPASDLVETYPQSKLPIGCLKQCSMPLSQQCQRACSACIEKYKQIMNFDDDNGPRNANVFNYDITPNDVIPSTEFENLQDSGIVGLTSYRSAERQLMLQDMTEREPDTSVLPQEINWEPEGPDSDGESGTFSILCQKINKHYMEDLNQDRSPSYKV